MVMLFLPPVLLNMFAVDVRWTVENGISARFVREEECAKTGCAGRAGARDTLEEACIAVNVACAFCDDEFVLFMADAGMGIADTL